MSKVIKGGTIVTADREWKSDILIEGEVIKQIGNNLTGDEVVDAEGAYVIPGGIDPHTHLEMPFMGTTAAETFESGTWAAAVGGTTMLVDFCLPGADGSLVNAINEWHRKSKPQICSYIGFHMAITGWNHQIFDEMPKGYFTHHLMILFTYIINILPKKVFKKIDYKLSLSAHLFLIQ